MCPIQHWLQSYGAYATQTEPDVSPLNSPVYHSYLYYEVNQERIDSAILMSLLFPMCAVRKSHWHQGEPGEHGCSQGRKEYL